MNVVMNLKSRYENIFCTPADKTDMAWTVDEMVSRIAPWRDSRASTIAAALEHLLSGGMSSTAQGETVHTRTTNTQSTSEKLKNELKLQVVCDSHEIAKEVTCVNLRSQIHVAARVVVPGRVRGAGRDFATWVFMRVRVPTCASLDVRK